MKLVALAALAGALVAQDNGDTTYGFGREPTEEEIRAIDIDVMPDGTGLPPGEGTVDKGRELYYQQCAACHGVTGTEGPNDVLVGRLPNDEFPFAGDPSVRKTIGNYWPYATTIYDYTYRAMPFDAPGSLAPDEVYSIVAFLLHMNDLIDEDVVIDANTLPEVEMPARDRFVRDDRSGGPELK